MVTYLYLLIMALVLFVIYYLMKKTGADSDNSKYLVEAPIDPNTHDDGKCEEVCNVVEEIDEKVEPVVAAEVKPDGLLDAPRDGKKDNITCIKGIGLIIEEKLNAIGVFHFDQIAVWTEENTAWADSQLSFPGRAKREDWIGQAKLLAEGKDTEFSKRVNKGEVSSSKKV